MHFKYFFLLIFLFIAIDANAQDYEIWGTLKVHGQINDKWAIEAEGENRYNFNTGNIRYLHYDVGALYSINKSFKVGLFYRDIFETENDVITRITIFHGDVVYSISRFKVRTRLEYIIKYHQYENKFRLRIRPGYQTNLWKNFNPFIQDEIFLSDIDEFTRNRLNIGVTINISKFQIQPGYLLESNYNGVNRNIFWINTKIKF